MRALPVHRELLEHLCAYDVVGFQTEHDLRDFKDAVSTQTGASILADGSLRYRDRIIRCGVFPIGVDVDACAQLATQNADSRMLEGIRASLRGRQLLLLARIGLVTPVRDGMNLVAMEYVAAQDPLDPGVLVLSTMAGAADELADAVLVNPRAIRGRLEGRGDHNRHGRVQAVMMPVIVVR
jgi:trehalose-6-phosphate synthase